MKIAKVLYYSALIIPLSRIAYIWYNEEINFLLFVVPFLLYSLLLELIYKGYQRRKYLENPPEGILVITRNFRKFLENVLNFLFIVIYSSEVAVLQFFEQKSLNILFFAFLFIILTLPRLKEYHFVSSKGILELDGDPMIAIEKIEEIEIFQKKIAVHTIKKQNDLRIWKYRLTYPDWEVVCSVMTDLQVIVDEKHGEELQ